MADLTTAERLTRFGENEERVQTFVNETGTYTTTENVEVETLPSFLARKNTEVNTATDSILAQATAAAEAAETFADAAEAAASNLSIRKYPASGPLIATAGQTQITPGFTLDTVKDNVAVYIDGVKQARGTYTFTATTITLSEALTGVETIEVFSADTTAAGSAPLYQGNNLSDILDVSAALANLGARVTPGSGKIPIADSNGKLDSWVTAKPLLYGACATAAATAAKVVTLSDFALATGARVGVNFSNANTVAGALTLNVNNTGDIAIYDESGTALSSSNPAYFPAGCSIEFVYDGAHWVFQNRVVKRYYSATMKSRMYADGYKIQQGTLSVASNQTVTISFPWEFMDTAYTPNRNYGINAASNAIIRETCCFNLTTTTMQTQVNTDHVYARWSAIGY